MTVKSLADDGESTVTASTYMDKEVLSIPQVGGWIRKALDYKWIVIVAAAVLIIIGCIPKGRQSHRKKQLEYKTFARSAEPKARVDIGESETLRRMKEGA